MKEIDEQLKGLTEKEQIKLLYKHVGRRVTFIEAAAVEFDRSVNTLINHWFAKFWQVPKSEIEAVKLFTYNYVKTIKETKTLTEI